MQPDPFAERLAIVRRRFASTLEAKIGDACAALPHLSGNDAAVFPKLADIYQKMHQICGVAPTIGFGATGMAARGAEDVLLPPFRGKRGLTADEAESLHKALNALRIAARSDLLSIDTREV